MVPRAVAVGLIAVVVCSTAVASVGTAGATQRPTDEPAPGIVVEAIPQDDSGAITYRISVDELGQVDRFALAVGGDATVTATDGFERTDDGARLVPAAGRTSGSVVIRVDAPGRSGDGTYVTGDGWALTRVPYAVARWSPRGADGMRSVRPLGDEFGALDDGSGTYRDRYAMVGERTVETHDLQDQQVRIVRPAGTELTAGSETVAATLRAASARLQVGDRDETLTLFAPTAPARAGGESFPARDEAWVRADSRVNSPNNVWVHEYVHTRQSFRLSEDMQWFREASAEYYAARFTHEQGRISAREMHAHLDGEGVDATLTRPDTWTDGRAPYSKGARVLAMLDRNIQQSTDGERSLQDVFERMNEHDGPVTYAEFKTMVTAVAGHSMDGWLDRYVATGSTIASAYHPEPARSGVLGVVDAVLAGDTSVLSTLAVSTLLGALLSVPLYAAGRRLRPEQFRILLRRGSVR
jgi:hypothetical protein